MGSQRAGSFPLCLHSRSPRFHLIGEGRGSFRAFGARGTPPPGQLLAASRVGWALLVEGKSCYPHPLLMHFFLPLVPRESPLFGGLGCPGACMPSHPTEHPQAHGAGVLCPPQTSPPQSHAGYSPAWSIHARSSSYLPLGLCSWAPSRVLVTHREPCQTLRLKATTRSCLTELAAPHLCLCLSFLLGTVGTRWLLPRVWSSVRDLLSAQRGVEVMSPSWFMPRTGHRDTGHGSRYK